jgi:hypothetical protein
MYVSKPGSKPFPLKINENTLGTHHNV